jgi:hypothetical protein
LSFEIAGVREYVVIEHRREVDGEEPQAANVVAVLDAES